MIAKAVLVILCLLSPFEVCADYKTLEDFRVLNTNNTVVYLQEDPLFFVRSLSDIPQNLQPFAIGFFGYNRLRIAEFANETSLAIDDIIVNKSLSAKQSRCIEDNKKIIVLILIDAMSDWSCIKGNLIDLVSLLEALLETLFEFSVMHEEECWFGPICLAKKGFMTAKLTAQVVQHGASLLKFLADFLLGLRVCQRKIKPFQSATKNVMESIQICTAI